MEYIHPYSRYGLALVMEENNLESQDFVKNEYLLNELLRGLGHFMIRPNELYEGLEKVGFNYMTYDFIKSNIHFQGKGNSDQGIFLCPNITTSFKQAGKTWVATDGVIEKLKHEKNSSENLTMSLFAASAKFNNGRKSQSTPKSTLQEVACAAITNTTPYKPCLAYRIIKKGTTDIKNTAIIPDLPLDRMIEFIALFKSMQSDVRNDLLTGRVFSNAKGKGKNEEIIYKPERPRIYNGNFPNPPKSSALGSVALLGAIGEWAKKSDKWIEGERVLDSLKNVPIYMVSYGNAQSFTYNHYIIELAKENKLNSVIDAVYYTKLFNAANRAQSKNEYQNFDLFASRFLQLFNRPSFKDFLSFRAEYPSNLQTLFNTYFIKMEKIKPEIVQSAKILGSWLNYAAYKAAKNEVENTKSEEFKKAKAKVLVELESSAFSARSGNALAFQVIRRAGLLSYMDAPSEADLFIEATCTGELPLDDAKNLLIAFSRLRSKYEKHSQEAMDDEESIDSENDELTDTSGHEE